MIKADLMRKKEEIFITNNFEETQKLGEKFVKRLHLDKGATLSKRRAVCLYGDLGSGKTTFVQGMARGLGIKRRIISPTFIIVRNYILRSQKSKVKSQNYNSKLKNLEPETFYHIDLYRTENIYDLKGLGLEEILNDSSNIVVIEWAEKMGKMLPKKRSDVWFEYFGEEKRKILIVSP